MADYSTEREDAYNDIKEAGSAIQLKHFSPGTYNPVTDASTATWTTDSTYGLFTGYSQYFIDGTRIKVGDRKLLVSAHGLSFTLEVGDKVIADSETWEIKDPNAVAPDGDPILYKAQIRRAG